MKRSARPIWCGRSEAFTGRFTGSIVAVMGRKANKEQPLAGMIAEGMSVMRALPLAETIRCEATRLSRGFCGFGEDRKNRCATGADQDGFGETQSGE
ncbi:hypothetical protein FHW19_004496 [Ochrobactrum anthropi]|uniref:hypothetical protein n=1 Tax=Brucella anthropi TaxID=529 RepID=UPI0015FDD891|nr:hypothetical protein [Brucella anthropi]MBA8862745.1 hypothetical protein [Brucella anthropi]